MRRSIFGPACVLTLCAGLATGCESLRPSTRKEAAPPRDEAVEAADGDDRPDRIEAVTSDGRTTHAPFFKNNRLKGGLSDQAQDIEASLGVK